MENKMIFNGNNVHLLNELVFDASFVIDEILQLNKNKETVVLNINRRILKDSYKGMLWHRKAHFKEVLSKLVFTGLESVKVISQEMDKELNNDFILEFECNEGCLTLVLKSVMHGELIQFDFKNKIEVILVD